MPERPATQQRSGQARSDVGRRLRDAREAAGLTLRQLARLITEDHGYQVSYAHLARLESGGRSINRALLLAWGAATGQADPQGWADELVTTLGQGRLGRSGRVLSMTFRTPALAEVPRVLKDEELPTVLRSPEMVYARVERLLEEGIRNAKSDGMLGGERERSPVLVTVRGPLARAFHEAQRSIAPGPIVPATADDRPVVQLALARLPEERLRAVEQMLAASARVPRPGLYEPLVTRSESDFDVIAVPGVGGALALGLPNGSCLWLSVPGADYPHLLEYLEPTLREARERRTIELVRFGTQMTRDWFGEWEPPLLKHEAEAEERLFLLPHLGLLTHPVDLATEKGRTEARPHGATDDQIRVWLQQRAERIAIFQRKVRAHECSYRDIAAYEALDHLAEDGHTYIKGVKPPADKDPAARLERLRQARVHLVHLRNLLRSDDGGSYELRLVPADNIPSNRLWSLVRAHGGGGEVLLTFTLSGQAEQWGDPESGGDQMPSFVNAIVRDAEVSRAFREEFDQLWSEAPGRQHTVQVLDEKIDKIYALTGKPDHGQD
jgi:transcriptional regulator with XRE-family HTH domain